MQDVPPPQPRNVTPLRVYLLALVVYGIGLWWGLPDGVGGRDRPWGTDELGPVGAINEVYGVFAARQPVFNPQYPLFHYLVQLVTVAPVYVGLWLTGHISMPAPLFPYGLDHPTWELPLLTLAARLPSLLMAAGVVVLALRTGTVLRDVRTGRWAALLAALLYPMIFYARTTNVDMGALFWMAAGLLVFARCLTGGTTPGRLWALGLFAALAAASKDANYAAFVPAGALATWWWVRARLDEGRPLGAALVAPLQAAALAAATYVVASGLVFRPSRFEQHLHYVTNGSGTSAFYFRYPATLQGYLAFAQEFGWQFVDAMGWPLLVCTLAGLVSWRAAQRLRLWVLPALSICLFVIVPVRFALLRFVLPVVYVLVFAAADVLARALQAPAPRLRLAARVAAVVVVGWTAARGLDLTWQMLRDSRTAATAWLAGVTTPGDTVGYFALSHQIPRMPDGVTATPVAADVLVRGAARPPFLVSVPLEDYERVHEEALPAEVYAALMDGRLGYRAGPVVQTPTWFSRRPATFVNPPIRFFVRDDVWQARPGTH